MTLEKSDIKVNVTTLDPSFLQSLKSCDVSVCENLTKGSYLYHQGDTADAFFFAESGLIGLYHVVDNGKESLIRLYESGQFFGYRTWFSSQKNLSLLSQDVNSSKGMAHYSIWQQFFS